MMIVAVSVSMALAPLATVLAEDDVQELKRQIEQLQKRVDELEGSQQTQSTPMTPRVFSTPSRQWDPFTEMERMQAEMDRMFRNSFAFGGDESKGMFRSDVFYHDTFDIQEQPDRYVVTFDMAGLDQANVNIQVNGNVLTVKCEGMQEQNEQDNNRVLQTQNYSSFMKSITLPDDADTTQMESKQEHNTLIITLPKK